MGLTIIEGDNTILEITNESPVINITQSNSPGLTVAAPSDSKVIEVMAGLKGDKGEDGDGSGGPGNDGADGREVELRATGTHIQWRYEGESWTDLIALSQLEGADGDNGRGISNVARTSGDGSAGTTDTYTITYSDASTSTFSVYNGSNGFNADSFTGEDIDLDSEGTETVAQAFGAVSSSISTLEDDVSDINNKFPIEGTTGHVVVVDDADGGLADSGVALNDIALVSGIPDVSGKLNIKGNGTKVLVSGTDSVVQYDIEDDGTPTAGWPNRVTFRYKPPGGTVKPVQWVNEYGELRVVPAKNNTVGLRVFVANDQTDFAARNNTVPVVEVASDRNDRTKVVHIFGDGKVDVAGEVVAPTFTGNLRSVRGDDISIPAWRTDFTGEGFNAEDSNTAEHWVNGVMYGYTNEWGAVRGTAPFADALVRCIRKNGDTVGGGNQPAIHIDDRRTGAISPHIYARTWNGNLWRNGVVMADTYVTTYVDPEEDPNYSLLPEGTVIKVREA